MKRRKRGWLALVVAFLATAFSIWLAAFLLWLFWPELRGYFRPEEKKSLSGQNQGFSREQIYEEERKRLEDMLKRKPSR